MDWMTWLSQFEVSLLCTGWLLLLWVGYATFAKRQAKKRHCLASQLHDFRILWMKRVMYRDNRITDTSLLASLERNSSFFANITVLVLAGIVTALSGAGDMAELLQYLPIEVSPSGFDIELKLLLLFAVFAYAFFSFTWAMRQYAFCSVLMGAFPAMEEKVSQAIRDSYAVNTARIMDQAGHSFNAGLRAYYFAMSFFAWLVSPWLFSVAVVLVVAVLYRREFRSKALKTLVKITEDSAAMELGEDL